MAFKQQYRSSGCRISAIQVNNELALDVNKSMAPPATERPNILEKSVERQRKVAVHSASASGKHWFTFTFSWSNMTCTRLTSDMRDSACTDWGHLDVNFRLDMWMTGLRCDSARTHVFVPSE